MLGNRSIQLTFFLMCHWPITGNKAVFGVAGLGDRAVFEMSGLLVFPRLTSRTCKVGWLSKRAFSRVCISKSLRFFAFV